MDYKGISIFYESPLLLQSKFIKDTDSNKYQGYLYPFEYIQNTQCILISPQYLGKSIPIQYYKIVDQQFFPSFKNIDFSQKYLFTKEELQSLLQIHDDFISCIFSKYIFKNNEKLGKMSLNIDEQNLEKEKFFKNYLFIPVKNFVIQFSFEKLMKDYFTNFNYIVDKLNEIKMNQRELRQQIVYEENKMKNKFIFCFYIGKLKNFTIEQYIDKISQLSCKFVNTKFQPQNFKQKIINSYNFDFLKLLNTNLAKCLDEQLYSIEEASNIGIFKPLIKFLDDYQNSEKKENYNEENYILGIQLPNLKNYDITISNSFSKDQKIIDFYQQIEDQKINPKKYRLFSFRNLKYSGFNCENLFGYYSNFAILKNFEYSIKLRELRMTQDLNYIQFQKMIVSFTSNNYERLLNYEVYETIGDIILKFLITLFVQKKFPDGNEGLLSQQRGNLVSNKNLRNEAMRNNFHFYIKQEKTEFGDFLPPCLLIDNDQTRYFKPVFLGKKTIADVVESLIGAAFLTTKRLFEPFYFLTQMNLIYEIDFSQYQDILFQNLLIDSDEFLQFEKDFEKPENSTLNIQSTWKDIFLYSKQKLPENNYQINENNNENEILLKLQQDIEYQFKDINLLKTALTPGNNNFERMEFLGDAILDLYCVLNLHNMADILKQQLFPEKLHGIKVFLLSKESLARFTFMYNIHCYIDFISSKQKENSLEFYEYFKPENEKIRLLWYKSEKISNKVLSDVFEAFIGAIFIDGGIVAVRYFLDDVFKNFLVFYLLYYKHILLDIKHYVIRFFVSKSYQIQMIELQDKMILKVAGFNLVEVKKKDGQSVKLCERDLCMEYLKNQQQFDQKLKKLLIKKSSYIGQIELEKQKLKEEKQNEIDNKEKQDQNQNEIINKEQEQSWDNQLMLLSIVLLILEIN